MFEHVPQRMLIIAAHPDDEVLGMGASLHRFIHTQGHQVRVVIMGEGLTSRQQQRDPSLCQTQLQELHQQARAAANVLGIQELKQYQLPDNRFDSLDILDIIKIIETEMDDFQPDWLWTHHGGDTNQDHRICFDASIVACRALPNQKLKGIISFEVPSSTEWQAFNSPNYFRPNLFLSLSADDLLAKQNAMSCYESERREFPHPRSSLALETLAHYRGTMSGLNLAEAFMLIRMIER